MSEPSQPGEIRSPFDEALGVRFEEVSAERVVGRLPVRTEHHQMTGIVHGGVYATLVETMASVGANAWLAAQAGTAFGAAPTVAVGLSNHTDFLRSVRQGELRIEATPVQCGRTLQLWQVDISDDKGRRVAHGKVKLMNVRPGESG